MARPERNTVDYFPFYCDDGKKMFYLEETYGNDGFTVLMKILKELAKTEYHYLDLSKNTTTMFLSAKCKVSKEVLESIINDLVELEKFDKTLWLDNRVIWCNDFIESIQDAYKKRNNNCITYDGLISLLISLGVRKPIKGKSKECVKPQIKEKDSKEEESKENKIPGYLEFEGYAIEKSDTIGIEIDLTKVKLKYEAWKENGWITMGKTPKKIKNWKSTLTNSLNYLKKEEEKGSARKFDKNEQNSTRQEARLKFIQDGREIDSGDLN